MASRRTAAFLARSCHRSITIPVTTTSTSNTISIPSITKPLTAISPSPSPSSSSSITSKTTSSTSRPFAAYAAVHHEQEYKEQMEGRHGQSLKLAIKEGLEKRDGTHFDPFEAYALPEDLGEDGDDEGIDDADAAAAADEEEDDFVLQDDDADSNQEEDETQEEEEEEDDSPIPTKEEAFQTIYNPDGSLRSIEPAQKHAWRAGHPAGGSFAILNLHGSQQKVTVDDVIILNKLRPVDHWSVGSTHTLTKEEVLLVGDQGRTLVGLPYVDGAEVDVMVEEITRDRTVLVFKKRRRKHSRRKNGFRREVTFLRVLDIRFPETK